MLIAAIFVMPAGASAAQIVPGEVVVQYEDPATGKAPSPAEAAPVVLQVDNVQRALEQLRTKSNVAYAVPNLVALISLALRSLYSLFSLVALFTLVAL